MRALIVPLLLACCVVPCRAEEVTLVTTLIERVNTLTEALGPELGQKLRYEFDDKARTEWSFFPGEHPGISMGACNDAQKAAVLDVLKVALSASGFEKLELVRELDDVLGATDGPQYTSDNYFLSLWGAPGEKGPWSLRWAGHHISLNWLVRDGRVMASTPQFIGSHPARVMEGPLKDAYPQAQEEQLGRALAVSLLPEQRAQGIVRDTAINDVITHSKPEVGPLDDEGIPYAALTADQQAALRQLIEVYIAVQAEPIARERARALSDESLATVRFAWFGSLEPGEKHYYRIQSATWVIEYANTQHNVNHIHTTWRDFHSDFGRDVLREHLALHHAEAASWLF